MKSFVNHEVGKEFALEFEPSVLLPRTGVSSKAQEQTSVNELVE